MSIRIWSVYAPVNHLRHPFSRAERKKSPSAPFIFVLNANNANSCTLASSPFLSDRESVSLCTWMLFVSLWPPLVQVTACSHSKLDLAIIRFQALTHRAGQGPPSGSAVFGVNQVSIAVLMARGPAVLNLTCSLSAASVHCFVIGTLFILGSHFFLSGWKCGANLIKAKVKWNTGLPCTEWCAVYTAYYSSK